MLAARTAVITAMLPLPDIAFFLPESYSRTMFGGQQTAGADTACRRVGSAGWRVAKCLV